MAEVKLINIEKTYEKGVKAVTNLSLSVKDKEFVVRICCSGWPIGLRKIYHFADDCRIGRY